MCWFIQMLRLHLRRHTLRRALVHSLPRSTQNDMVANSSTTADCPSHTSTLRAGSATQVLGRAVRMRPLSTTAHKEEGLTAAEGTGPVERNVDHDRIQAEVLEAKDVAGLLALVRRETILPPGPEKRRLRFSMANSVKWLQQLSHLSPCPLHGRPPPEVSLVLSHILDLVDARSHHMSNLLLRLASTLAAVGYKGGQRNAVLDRVVGVCLRAGQAGMDRRYLKGLRSAFSTAGYDPGPEVKALLRTTMREMKKRRREGGGRGEGVRETGDGGQEEGTEISQGEEGGVEGEEEEGRGGVGGGEGLGGGGEAALLASLASGDVSRLVSEMSGLSQCPSDPLLKRVEATLGRRGAAGQLDVQQVCALLEAFVRWRRVPSGPLLLMPLCEGLLLQQNGSGLSEGWGARELATLLHRWALWRFHPPAALLDAVSLQCEQKVKGLDGPSLSRVVTGFARLRHPPGLPLLRQVCLRAPHCWAHMHSDALYHLLSGLAALSYYPGQGLLTDVARLCAERRFQGLGSEKLGALVRDLAMCNHVVEGVFLDAFYRCCAGRGGEGWGRCERRALQLTLWGLVGMGAAVDEGLLRAILGELEGAAAAVEGGAGAGAGGTQGLGALRRAVRIHLYLREEPPRGVEVELERALQRLSAILTQPALAPNPSETQRSLCERLRRRYRVEEEATVAMVSVDMLIHLPGGLKVAVEVDGPLHFFYNDINEPTGATRLKRRVLDEATRRGTIQSWVWVRSFEDRDVQKVDEAVRVAQARGRFPVVSE